MKALKIPKGYEGVVIAATLAVIVILYGVYKKRKKEQGASTEGKGEDTYTFDPNDPSTYNTGLSYTNLKERTKQLDDMGVKYWIGWDMTGNPSLSVGEKPEWVDKMVN